MAKQRKDYNDIYKWNTKDLFESDNKCLDSINLLDKKINKLDKYKGKILKDAKMFLSVLELDSNISRKLERIYIYAHINNDADTLSNKYQELYGKARMLYTKYLEHSSFIVPEILQSDYKLVKKYIKEENKLKKYERSLKEIFREKKYILDVNSEKVLSSLSNVISSFDEIMGALTDSDFKFDPITKDGKTIELTESNFSIYLKDDDRDVRKQAFNSIYKRYGEYKNTLAKLLKSEVEKNVSISKLRGYKSSLERALFPLEMDASIYHNLINGVHNNLNSLYKYFDIKKRILKLDELHIYDTYTDISINNNHKYSFEDAKDLVLKIVEPLGSTYRKDLSKSFSNRWIDSCNNVGKRGGAYCTSCYDVHPYVLMSFENSLNDVSTLAHELGHAMHYYYACKYQNYEDYNYSIFVAEVASQVNEILLSRYLLDNGNDKKEKLKIIDDLLQKYKSTIFRQTMFAEFELFIHEYTEAGNILTSDVMCNKYLELNKLYFGKNVCVDEDIKYEWERIPHFYMNYYVWKYATGFVAATYLANNIYEGNKDIRNKYLEFLKLGCSKNPIDSLKVAGVDMLDSKVFDESINYMNELLKEYEKIYKEVKDE